MLPAYQLAPLTKVTFAVRNLSGFSAAANVVWLNCVKSVLVINCNLQHVRTTLYSECIVTVHLPYMGLGYPFPSFFPLLSIHIYADKGR